MEIVSYKKEYASAFKSLNIAWLEKYFYVENYDKEVLGKPEEYIITPGGYIFFTLDDTKKITGTVALIPMEDGLLELSKMAVAPAYQGKGVGQKLMAHCIAFAKAKAYSKLVLYSNTILENAIYIYRKWGFVEVPLEKDNIYDRSNIKMEVDLTLI